MEQRNKRTDKLLRRAAQETIKSEKQRQKLLRKTERLARRQRREEVARHGWEAQQGHEEGPAAQGEPPTEQAEEGLS
jgi:hypothetical protein